MSKKDGLKVYFETRLGKLYCGNALEVLRKLPSESVDTVITSPPYWSKRDYGEEAIDVWGGDPNCEHEWVEDDRAPTKLFHGGHGDPKYKKANTSRPESTRLVCRKCGAWLGQLGLESTPEMFVEHLVEIFDEVKRVLKPTGNLFVNIDDTYLWRSFGNGKQRSLALVPELFALKMVYEKGWVLREKIIWAKKVYIHNDQTTVGNGMPEPVKNRFAHVWEYIFHFTKRPSKYYFNLDDVKVPFKTETIKRMHRALKLINQTGLPITPKNKYFQALKEGKINEYGQAGILTGRFMKSKYLSEEAKNTRSMGGRLVKVIAEGKVDRMVLVKEAITNVNAYLKQKLKESGLTLKQLSELTGIKETQLAHYFRTDLSGATLPSREVWEILKPILNLDDYDAHVKEEYKSVIPTPHPKGANPGDVIQINLKPFKGAHFAVFPPDIPEILIKVSAPPKVCSKCGMPYQAVSNGGLNKFKPLCSCNADPLPGVVLDPFGGAGTTLVVAEKLGFRWIGIEINEEYCELIKKRFKKEGLI